MSRLNWIALAMVGALAVGCDNKGPMEQAGEEVDEAVDTMKDGGESTADKVDDAMDELRE